MECALHKVHNPSVAVMQTLCVGQGDLDSEFFVVCPTGYQNVVAYRDYLLGSRDALPVKVGTTTKRLAERMVAVEYARNASRDL